MAEGVHVGQGVRASAMDPTSRLLSGGGAKPSVSAKAAATPGMAAEQIRRDDLAWIAATALA